MEKTKMLTFLAAGACALSAVAAGVQTTLKATNPKGLVFAGWYGEDGSPLAGGGDYRSPSLPYAMPDSVSAVWARYALAQDDATSLGIDVEDRYSTSGAFDLTLNVRSLSFPKVAVSGLPAGLQFDAKNLRIYGTAKKPGTYTVTAKLTNASVKKATVKTFTIVVDNLTGANELLSVRSAADGATALRNARGERYVISAGVSELDLPVLNAANSADKLTLSGLPPGLKYNAGTGRIEGVATKAGTYTVTATVKSGKASSVSTFTVEVRALPEWAVGTFKGVGWYDSIVYDDDDMMTKNMFGTLTVAANGRVTGKIAFGWERVEIPIRNFFATFAAQSLTGYDAETGFYYLDAEVFFNKGGAVIGDRRTRRFYLKPAAYDSDGKLTVGEIHVEEDDFRLRLTQDVLKRKDFTDRPSFTAKKTTVSIARPVSWHEWIDGMGYCWLEGTGIFTLVISSSGAVTATYAESDVIVYPENSSVGKYYKNYCSRSIAASLMPTRHMKARTEEYYLAEVPVFSPGGDTAISFELKLPVSPDGKIYERSCEFVSISDIPVEDIDEWPF